MEKRGPNQVKEEEKTSGNKKLPTYPLLVVIYCIGMYILFIDRAISVGIFVCGRNASDNRSTLY